MDRRSNGLIAILTRTPFTVDNYIGFSTLIFTVALGVLINTFRSHPELDVLLKEEMLNSTLVTPEAAYTISEYAVFRIGYYILSNQAMTWVLVNTYFAFLALCARLIIRWAFHDLSRQEEHSLRQGFFTFLLFHIVFLSVIASNSPSHRILPWLFWFGAMAFLTVLHDVVHQRFKFVSPTAGRFGSRLSWMCFFLFVITTIIFGSIIREYRLFDSVNWLFLLTDSLLMFIRASHALARCLIATGIVGSNPDKIRHLTYNLDLGGAILTDGIQFLNYIRLMLFSNSPLTLTWVFFFYHARLAFNSIAKSLHRHRKHQTIFAHIQSTYPLLEEPSTDLCIVCWEELSNARSLPCEHAFHDWCLMWWLEQDPSCPTCRRPVSTPHTQASRQDQQPRQINTQWRFGGHWLGFLRLPTFSIEFSHNVGTLVARRQDESQLNTMAEQVREMFPQLNMEPILEDLRLTGSVQSTIENILEGRVGFVPLPDEDEDDSSETAHLAGGDAAMEEDEMLEANTIPLTNNSSFSFEQMSGTSYFQKKRLEMIVLQRKLYLQSSRGADLRARGMTE